ncbi:thioredoxin-like protein [Tuber indicum]|nr:thioredoxin-like protein [Tuber indicum]
MPVSALQAVSKSRNGVGAFILQCKRMEFNFCDWAGSSKGMRHDRSFLKHSLPQFAKENPQIEIIVAPRPNKIPIIRGAYINGREKVIAVDGLEIQQILQKAQLLRDSSGAKLKRITKPVISLNESVRGIFSPFHGKKHVI